MLQNNKKILNTCFFVIDIRVWMDHEKMNLSLKSPTLKDSLKKSSN